MVMRVNKFEILARDTKQTQSITSLHVCSDFRVALKKQRSFIKMLPKRHHIYIVKRG